MKNVKIYVFAVILIVVVVLFWVLTEAFHLLTAPSDLSVLGGVLLMCAAILVIIKLSIFAIKKLFK